MEFHFFNINFSFFKKNKKLLLIAFSIFFSLWIVIIALFPVFFSKSILCRQINKHIKGKVTIKKASMSWLRTQKFEKITAKDSQDNIILEIDSLTTQASLLSLITNKKNLKETNIRGLKAHIYPSGQKSPQVISPFGSSGFLSKESSLNKKSSVYIFKIPLFGQFHVDQSKLTIYSSHHEPIEFQDIQFYCQLPERASSFKAHLACESSQGNLSGSMNVNLEVGGFDDKRQLIITPQERDLFFLSPEGFLDLNAQITHLPSDSLDHVLTLFNPKLSSLFSNTVGGPLDLGAHLHLVKNKSKIDLNAHAKDLDLRFCGALQQNQFFLTEPSTCRLQIHPHLIKNLSSSLFAHSSLSSQDTAEALIQIDRLTMPLDAHNFNFSNLSCNAQLSLSPMKFTGDKRVQNFEISQVKGTVDTFDLNENVMIHLNMSALDNQKPIHLKVDGQLSKLIDNKNELKGIEQIKAQFVAQAKDFPTSFALCFFKEKALGKEVLGPSFNLDTTFSGSLSSALLNMNLESSRVKVSDIEFRLRDKNLLTLTEPTKVSFRITPSLAKKAADSFSILHPIRLEGDLKNCELKLARPKTTFTTLCLDLKASAFDFFISTYKPCHIDQSQLTFRKSPKHDLSCSLAFKADLPKDMPFYHLNHSFKADVEIDKFLSFMNGKPSPIHFNFNAENWKTSFEAYLDRQLNLKLTNQMTLEIDSPTFISDGQFSVKSQNLQLNLSPISLNILSLNPQGQDFNGVLYLKDLDITKGAFSEKFDSLTVPFEYNAKSDQATLAMKDEKTLSAFQLNCKSLFKDQKFDLKNGQFNLIANAKGISPNFLNAFSTANYDFESILGAHLDMSINSHFSFLKLLEGDIQYTLYSSILKSEGHLTFGEQLRLAKPGLLIDYFMSPASYLALNQFINKGPSSSILLEEPLSLKIEVDTLSKVLNENAVNTPLAFDGKVIVDKFITNKGSLFDLSGKFNTSNIFNNLKLNFSGKTTNVYSKEGCVHFSAELTEPFSRETKGINSKINGFIDCRLTHFPTALLTEVTEFKKEELAILQNLVGPSFDLHCCANLKSGNGPLKGSLKSDHISTRFSLSFEKDHLNLEEDLLAQLRFDQNSSAFILSKVNPLFAPLNNSSHSFNLKIPKQGFYLPASPFSLSEIQINSATLSMEKFQVENTPFYSKLLKFLKSDSESKILEVWATPTVFSFKNKALKVSRTDFLVNNSYHLAFWGDYNLELNKGDFFLSIPPSTLKKTFHISKLPQNYMFQIPIHKEGKKLSVDWATAAAQIGILGITSKFESPAHYMQQNPNSSLDEILDLFAKTQPTKETPNCPYTIPWDNSDIKDQTPRKQKEASQEEQTEILQKFIRDLRKTISK